MRRVHTIGCVYLNAASQNTNLFSLNMLVGMDQKHNSAHFIIQQPNVTQDLHPSLKQSV